MSRLIILDSQYSEANKKICSHLATNMSGARFH